MSVGPSIPDDLLLIMQSYIDPPTPDKPLTAGAGRQLPPVRRAVANEESDESYSEEDEVEMAIEVELNGEEPGSLGNKPILRSPRVKQEEPSSDSDSDSDSDSSDSTDVELRVTNYPKAKQPASSGPNDLEIDEDDAPSGSVTQYSGTKNEVLLPEVLAPELAAVPPEDVLELIGEVMTIIDSVVVIKGHDSGVHRVLDTDSLLAFDNREVLGVVFETFGAVKQPLYSVRFPSASAIDKNNVHIGRLVYHVPARSNFVFTQEIARIKGSDASNLHDEEVAEDQMEFSDDEAEAQWRRNRKEAKRNQASSSIQNPQLDTTPRQAKTELPTVLPYPAADDGDVPYSALPYDDEVADPRPAPAAYDPYSDHEEEPKASSSLPPRPPVQSSPQMNWHGNEPGGSRGRGNERGRRGQTRRGRPDERGRPKRGRGGRGRGRGDRRQGRGGGGFFPDYQSDQYADPASTLFGSGQYPFASHDEGYNPTDPGSANWDQNTGTMPHINPRFFSGEMQMGTDPSSGFGMQWGGMPGFDYAFQQSAYGGYNQGNDGGYNQGNDVGYNQNYNASYWAPNDQSYPSQGYHPPRGQS